MLHRLVRSTIKRGPPGDSDAVRTMTVHLAIVSVSTPFSLVRRCQASEAPRTHRTLIGAQAGSPAQCSESEVLTPGVPYFAEEIEA